MASLVLKFGVDHLESYQNCIFTNGCFDILHRGHIELFRFCYKQSIMGRPAVVGVNSDRSIKELKGTNRPIMGEEDRLAVLRAIKWIAIFIIPWASMISTYD